MPNCSSHVSFFNTIAERIGARLCIRDLFSWCTYLCVGHAQECCSVMLRNVAIVIGQITMYVYVHAGKSHQGLNEQLPVAICSTK